MGSREVNTSFKTRNKKSAVISVTSERKPTPPQAAQEPPATEVKQELEETTYYIAVHLNETKKFPRSQIAVIVQKLGSEKALLYLKQVQEIEQSGGMLTLDGKRRRTPGGVFLRIVKDEYPGILYTPPRNWKEIHAKKKAQKLATQQQEKEELK